jgi:RNA polymerase sigma-B factor
LATALDELRQAVDGARADRTVPRQSRRRPWRPTARHGTPSVEPSVWLIHERYFVRRRAEDRDALIVEYREHALRLARRYHRHAEPIDDLQQVALEALVRAIERFDPGRGLPFMAFATPTIIGSIKRHYRDTGWALRVPREVHTLAGPVLAAQTSLQADLGRPPTNAEIADLLDVPTNAVERTRLATAARATDTLDRPGAADVVSSDRELQRAELQYALDQCRAALTNDDRQLITWYFDEGLRQVDIAQRLGCSQMHVSRMLRRVLGEMRGLLS